MRVLHLSNLAAALLDVLAWGIAHAATGYLAHRWPDRRLQRDGWLLRPRRWETTGFYAGRLRIKRWKDRLPEAGALFAGGTSKAHVDAEGVERLVVETRRAELAHWWCLAAGPVFVLWNPAYAVPLLVAYGIGVNLPFIAVQRYNRLRATRVLARRSAATPRSSTASTERDDGRAGPRRSGRSIP